MSDPFRHCSSISRFNPSGEICPISFVAYYVEGHAEGRHKSMSKHHKYNHLCTRQAISLVCHVKKPLES